VLGKIYLSLLILLPALALSACGGSAPAPTPTTIAQATTGTSLPEVTATPDPSTDPLKLPKGSIGSFGGGDRGGDSGDTTIYKALVDHDQDYSIWPANRENPLGWYDAGKVGTRDEVMAYIDQRKREIFGLPKPTPTTIAQATTGTSLPEVTATPDTSSGATELTATTQGEAGTAEPTATTEDTGSDTPTAEDNQP